MFGSHDPSHYEYFVDNRLCFGVSYAPAIFNRLSIAIVRMMARRGFHSIVNYLDDFLIVDQTKAECQQGLLALVRLLHSLGFNVSWKKVVSPCRRVNFLGIELDSTTMSLRFPSDKLDCLILLSCPLPLKVPRPSVNCNPSQNHYTLLVISCKAVTPFFVRLLTV